MKHIKSIMNNKIVHMILAVLIFLFISSFVTFSLTSDSKNYNMVKLDSGWHVLVNGKDYSNDYKLTEDIRDISVNNGDKVVFIKKLTKDIIKNNEILYPIIALETKNCYIDVYINDKKIVRNYKDDRVKANFYGRLPEIYKDATLRIELKIYGNEVSNIINEILIISENNYFLYQLRDNLLKHVAGTYLIVLGIILLIIVVAIPNKAQEFRKLVWVGAISLFGGIGLYAKFDLLNLYINRMLIIEIVMHISLFVCIISVLLMARSVHENKSIKRNINSLIIGMGSIYIVMEILYILRAIRYSDMQVGLVISIVIIGIMLLYYNVKNYDNVTFLEKKYILGISLCYAEIIVTGLFSIIIDEKYWEMIEKYLLLLIIVTFLMATIIYYANVLHFYMDKVTQKNILLHVAYTDYLTGLNNRAKYEEVIEEINNDELADMIIISFDLDNLKKINDDEGHDAGDIYIKTFAKALKANLEQYGFLGRTGGDEFCSILKSTNIDIMSVMNKIQEMFSYELREERWNEKISFSYGYAYGNEIHENDIIKLIELADNRMYEYKAESKKDRSL